MALLVASHDRAFLDATVERVWELRDRRLTVFRGDYAAYHRQRIERDARLDKDVSTQAEQIAREQELVQRYRSHRKYAKMHEHEARLARLQEARIEAPKAARKLRLPTAALVGGGGPSRSGEIVVRAENLVVGYLPRFRQAHPAEARDDADDRPGGQPVAGGPPPRPPIGSPAEPLAIARVPFLAAQRGDRIGIVGPNGAGKTTLLRTIAGDLPPLDGLLTIGMGVSIGYLAQLRDAAIPGETVLGALTSAISITEGEARGYLARFLFRGDDAFKEVRTLSGGERSRLELALLGIMPANLLLLDEPTNHLDIPAREAIEAFMAAARPRSSSCPTIGACSRRCATGCGSWTMAWRRRSTAATRPGGRRLPRAGRSPRRSRPTRSGCGPAARAAARRKPGSRLAPGPVRLEFGPRGLGARPGAAGRRESQPEAGREGRCPPSAAEALEGRLSQAEGGRRCRADPARPAQEPP